MNVRDPRPSFLAALAVAIILAALVLLSGCAAAPEKEDYRADVFARCVSQTNAGTWNTQAEREANRKICEKLATGDEP